jgi:hypothetical protein
MWAYLEEHVPHASMKPPLEFDWMLNHRGHGINGEHDEFVHHGDRRG